MKTTQDIPKLGVISFVKRMFQVMKDPLGFHHKNFSTKGDTYQLRIGSRINAYFSRDAALAEYAFVKHQRNFTKSIMQTEYLAKYIGNGLLTAEGEFWRKQRKLIQPAFHKKQLALLLDTMKEAICSEYKNIETGKPIDMFPIFSDLAFKTVVKSLFSDAATNAQIKQLQHITGAVQDMLVKELRLPFLNWWFRASGKIKSHLNLTVEARAVLKQIVDTRKASGEQHDDLLDMLLNATYDDGSAITEQQLIDEILILFTAGYETTSNALSFTLQLLALHPEWQDKIYDEITTIEHQDADIMNMLMQTKVCKQALDEAMRLYPPAFFIDRVTIEDDAFNGMQFKANTTLLFSIYEIHRHPKYWEQPNDFLPERFKDGDKAFTSFYFPFGAGPRKCIGNNFAMFEMIIAIVEIVKRYQITPKFKDIETHPLITFKPKNAIFEFRER